ncbi:MAG: hypothetical protein P1V18_03725 [Candidatus Gracilibacteria bacterium]|nr:hypothetical protein [Candidatus Gracilibacteria bacterium]
MNLLEKLKNTSQKNDPLMVGGVDGIETAVKPSRDVSEVLYWCSLGLLVVTLLGAYLYTADLIRESEVMLKKYHQTLQEKGTEEKNLEALQVLSAQVDTLKTDQALVEKAVPFDSRYDQVVAFLEYTFNRLKKDYVVFVPENIGWTQLSPDDVTNSDFQSFDIMEYSVDYTGEYDGLLALLQSLKEHERLMDVQSLGGLQLLEDGLVSVQVSFWAYHLVL